MVNVTAAPRAIVQPFIKKLRLLRNGLDFTGDDFALFIGSKGRTVQSWFSGKSKPSVESINAVNEALVAQQLQLDKALRAVNTFLTK
jgi:transcriptional regulator with XRE-family HTH domain